MAKLPISDVRLFLPGPSEIPCSFTPPCPAVGTTVLRAANLHRAVNLGQRSTHPPRVSDLPGGEIALLTLNKSMHLLSDKLTLVTLCAIWPKPKSPRWRAGRNRPSCGLMPPTTSHSPHAPARIHRPASHRASERPDVNGNTVSSPEGAHEVEELLSFPPKIAPRTLVDCCRDEVSPSSSG
jgi:hypothetical protein